MTDNILFTLQDFFGRSLSLKFSEYFFFTEAVVQKSEGKCNSSKECVTTCKDYIIGREITTILRIAVELRMLQLSLSLHDK